MPQIQTSTIDTSAQGPMVSGAISRAAATFAAWLLHEGLSDRLSRVEAMLIGAPGEEAGDRLREGLRMAGPFDPHRNLMMDSGDKTELTLQAYDGDGLLLLRACYPLNAEVAS